MKISAEMIRIWNFLEENFTSLSTAIDCFGYPCRAWSQEAVAWDATGVLEYWFYDPTTNKYDKRYDEVVKLLRQCASAQNKLKLDSIYDDQTREEYMADLHSQWWGAILTAKAIE